MMLVQGRRGDLGGVSALSSILVNAVSQPLIFVFQMLRRRILH